MTADFDERGAVGGLEGLAFGALIFVFGTLMVVSAWAVVDAKLATSAAAREAARAYVEADDQQSATRAALVSAEQTMRAHNHPGQQTLIGLAEGGQYGRCRPVEVSVTLDVPRLRLPLLGSTAGTYRVQSDHIEIVDPYRSGLAGAAACTP